MYTHLRIPVEDSDEADLLVWLRSASEFIYRAIESGGIVLVHSHLGQSRSAAVVAAHCRSSERLP
jgi:protein-tyrosine phosphatase